MAEEKIFVKGLFAEAKESNFGGFTKLSFKVEDVVAFLNEHKNEKGYVNVNIFKSREGKPYCTLDTFKPTPKETPKEEVKSFMEDDTLPF